MFHKNQRKYGTCILKKEKTNFRCDFQIVIQMTKVKNMENLGIFVHIYQNAFKILIDTTKVLNFIIISCMLVPASSWT